MAAVKMTVNGKAFEYNVPDNTLLVSFIRETLGLTGTHIGCDTSQNHGLQCGFCTPGMIMSAIELVEKNKELTEQQIREGLEGNICRCTGYHNIIKSVQAAANEMRV